VLADPERIELPTPAFEAQCSIHLSYGSGPALRSEYHSTKNPALAALQIAVFASGVSESLSPSGGDLLPIKQTQNMEIR
jgi:hypothetical protein